MVSRNLEKTTKIVSPVVALCLIIVQVTCFLPGTAWPAAAEDLKNIVYKYYFRGNYERAVVELRAFLERNDLEKAEMVQAREYLAASLILGGETDSGRDEFLKLLKADGAYGGPDPGVFKAVVVDTYKEVKSEFASMVLRNAPDVAIAGESATALDAQAKKKPFYKKWWFYATIGGALVLVAAAAGSGGDDDGTPAPTGSVTVEVDLP